MYYSTAASGEIMLGENFQGAEYQLHFPGQVSDRYHVSASLFAKGNNFEIGYQYFFNAQGQLIRASHVYTNRDGTEILDLTRTGNVEAVKEFLMLKRVFSSLIAQGKSKVKREYQPTIDAICVGPDSLFRN